MPNPRRRPPVLDWLALALLCLLVQVPGLLHWIDSNPLPLISSLGQGGAPGLLPGFPGWIDPNIGQTTQALGHLAASDWLAGRLPWWNPYSGIGVPLAAEMQPAALFLPFVLLLHLHDGLLWLRVVMCAIGGIGAYELARQLGYGRPACWIAGLLFAFNGTAAWLPHGPERAAAFLPWVLLGVERAHAAALQGRRLGWLCLALAVAASIYAGFPEVAYLDGLLAALWSAWRLARPGAEGGGASLRLRLLGKLTGGLAVALLLSAPATLPFAEYLRRGDVGAHAAGWLAHARLPHNGFPLLLLPYLYGPIEGWPAPVGTVVRGAWGLTGGYLSVAATVLALLRLVAARGRDGGLRWLLAFWIALCLAKTAALPGVTHLVNLLPLLRRVAFFRYAEPSWELAAILLAAAAVDDWRQAALAWWRALLAGVLAAALLAVALVLAWPTILALSSLPGYAPFPIFAAEWALLLAVLLPLLLARPPRAWRRGVVLGLVGLDAVAMFALPLASATQGVRIDRAPIDFLRAHLGLQRFYSMTALPPNYGALFGIAQINDDMLPVPRLWAEHVRAALDPLAVPATFSGSNGSRPPGPNARDMLFSHVDAYRALGVRYVVTPRGEDSLDGEIAAAELNQAGTPLVLAPGASVGGTLPAGFAQGRAITEIGVSLGTYAGLADGELVAELCTPRGCERARAALRGAADGAVLSLALAAALPTAPGDALRFTLAHRGGSHPVVAWLLPGSLARLDGVASAVGPGIVLGYARTGTAFRRVFRDAHVDIFELSGAAPYFSADGGCVLAPSSRTALTANCSREATLTRRELAFPGWRVTVDGRHAVVGSSGIFQTIALTAGRSTIRFRYAPRHIATAWAAAVLGLASVAVALLLSRPGALAAVHAAVRALAARSRGALRGCLAALEWRPRWLPPRGLCDRALIVLLPLLVWLPALLGVIDANPALMLTGLGQGGGPGLIGGLPGWLDPNIGFTTQALGREAANAWLAGTIPWWNHLSGVGAPLAAEMQPAALFLPFILLLHWDVGMTLLRFSMQAIGGLATYELLRTMGLRRSACLAGGVLFAFNGTAAWLPHGPDRAAAFLPLILLGVERSREAAMARIPLGWTWLAVGLAYSLYAGFPETAFLDGLLAVAWAGWRLVAPASPGPNQIWAIRRRLLGKLAAGLIVSLLLAMPILLPFFEFLRVADVGGHGALFAEAALPRNGFPLFLVPFLYGNIGSFGASGPGSPTWSTWGEIGGYVGAAATTLAAIGLVGSNAGLRWLLALWVAACLGKTAAVAGITPLFNAIPMITQTAFFRYAEPSWALAVIVLAAFGIDAWLRGRIDRRRTLAASTLAAGLLAAALYLAWPTMLQLWPQHHYSWRLVAALSWCALVMLALLLSASGHPARWRSALIGAIVCLDAAMMFGVPLLASARGERLDRRPIDFLRSHLGLQRVYALGVLAPNYSAYFGIAAINDTLLPVPEAWSRHVRTVLDPLGDAIVFDGSARTGRPAQDQPAAALRARIDAYRALAVRYVVAPAGERPLLDQAGSLTIPPGSTPRPLAGGSELSGALPADLALPGRTIVAVGIAIGTYGGQSDGELAATLCTSQHCGSGTITVQGAADNAAAMIPLNAPLRVSTAGPLWFGIRYLKGEHPVAVWTSPGSAAVTAERSRTGGPLLRVAFQGPKIGRLVFSDPRVDIFELDATSPYASAGSNCSLDLADRDRMTAACSKGGTLIRRELSFPGWRARINGRPVALGASGIFQSLALPAGRSHVVFRYAPPYEGLAYAAAAAGALWMLLAWGATAAPPPWRRPRRAL